MIQKNSHKKMIRLKRVRIKIYLNLNNKINHSPKRLAQKSLITLEYGLNQTYTLKTLRELRFELIQILFFAL